MGILISFIPFAAFFVLLHRVIMVWNVLGFARANAGKILLPKLKFSKITGFARVLIIAL